MRRPFFVPSGIALLSAALSFGLLVGTAMVIGQVAPRLVELVGGCDVGQGAPVVGAAAGGGEGLELALAELAKSGETGGHNLLVR